MAYYLLFNAFIPLDIQMSLIMNKLIYTWFIEWDAEMVDEDNGIDAYGQPIGCSVHNLMMHEDLAKITHIFCDKTGTLTKNKLIFRSIAYGNNVFRLDPQNGHTLSNFKDAIK